MITIEQQGELIRVAVLGEFTLADFKEFEVQVLENTRKGVRVDVLFDLSQMAGFTLDVAWEEIQFSRQHAHEFHRFALVTDSQWALWSAWLARLLVEAEIEVFESPEDALAWLAGSGGEDV